MRLRRCDHPDTGHGPCSDCQRDRPGWLDVGLALVVLVLAGVAFAGVWSQR